MTARITFGERCLAIDSCISRRLGVGAGKGTASGSGGEGPPAPPSTATGSDTSESVSDTTEAVSDSLEGVLRVRCCGCLATPIQTGGFWIAHAVPSICCQVKGSSVINPCHLFKGRGGCEMEWCP